MTKWFAALALVGACQKSAAVDDGPNCKDVTAHIADIMRQGKPEMGKIFGADVANCEQRKLPKEKRTCLMAAKTVAQIASCHAGRVDGSGSPGSAAK